MTRLPQFQGRNLRLLAIVVLVTAAVLVTLAFEGALAHWNGLLPVFTRETDHKPSNYGVGGRPQEKNTLAASTQSRKWEGKEAVKHNQIMARELWKHVKSFADVLGTKKSPGIGDILQHFLHYAWMHWSKWYARCLDCPKIRPIQAQMSHGNSWNPLRLACLAKDPATFKPIGKWYAWILHVGRLSWFNRLKI